MTVSLTITRYRKRYIFFALLAMALFRLPLWFNKKISFWKLLGSGKNGTFDKTPDWQQWGVLAVHDSVVLPHDDAVKQLYNGFIAKWLRWFGYETITYLLTPVEGHGLWDGKKAFGELPSKSDHDGIIAVLTRATIRISKLKQFWKHVDPVAAHMAGTDGFITSYGIGEMPWLKQATFSIWQNKEAMKAFAYTMKEHAEVIRKTRQEKWYSEDMFVRFKIDACIGTLKGTNPLNGKL
jgi:heme-degrading monooxygenase HmoA